MKKIISLITLNLLAVSSVFSAVNPSSLKVKVYAVYASTSPLCTNATEVFLNGGTYVDFLAGPELGGGDLPDGTYHCVIIKMSSIIKHTPATTESTCVAATEYTGGVCNAGEGAVDSLTGTGDIACTGTGSMAGSVDSTVFMFMTTDAAASTGNKAFHRPAVAGDGNGIKLGAPLTISSTTRAKFVVNANGQVVAGGGECGINAPAFSFVNL